MRIIDGKFQIDNDKIIKTSNGEEIPLDEPVFLFRARDYLALSTLFVYLAKCSKDGCTDYQLDLLQKQIEKFQDFKITHPDRMKQPGITLGK